MVDASLPLDVEMQRGSSAFRYRETSPVDFGLSSAEIFAATDAQLNNLAGLKRLVPYRDADRKQRDRRKITKKSLKRWRKDVFGSTKGYEGEPNQLLDKGI